jgi:uncharacterized glyoxalase superfamily protein PhnB
MPGATDVPPELQKAILYARMTIGETYVMGSDVSPDRFKPMRSVYLSMAVDTSKEAERIHALLSEGGGIFMPMQERFLRCASVCSETGSQRRG